MGRTLVCAATRVVMDIVLLVLVLLIKQRRCLCTLGKYNSLHGVMSHYRCGHSRGRTWIEMGSTGVRGGITIDLLDMTVRYRHKTFLVSSTKICLSDGAKAARRG